MLVKLQAVQIQLGAQHVGEYRQSKRNVTTRPNFKIIWKKNKIDFGWTDQKKCHKLEFGSIKCLNS